MESVLLVLRFIANIFISTEILTLRATRKENNKLDRILCQLRALVSLDTFPKLHRSVFLPRSAATKEEGGEIHKLQIN